MAERGSGAVAGASSTPAIERILSGVRAVLSPEGGGGGGVPDDDWLRICILREARRLRRHRDGHGGDIDGNDSDTDRSTVGEDGEDESDDGQVVGILTSREEALVLNIVIELALAFAPPEPAASPAPGGGEDLATLATATTSTKEQIIEAPDTVPDADAAAGPAAGPSEAPLAAMIELFPDADPDWLEERLDESEDAQEAIVKVLEFNGKFPKRQNASSKKRARDGEDDGENAKRARDWNLPDPNFFSSPMYIEACVNYMAHEEFPRVYMATIKEALQMRGNQLIPACLYVRKMLSEEHPRPITKKIPTKGKGPKIDDVIFETHLVRWRRMKVEMAAQPDKTVEEATPVAGPSHATAKDEEAGDPEAECGCCYGDYRLTEMTQCEDGHLFCLECARKAAENLIGLRKTELPCIDSSGCKFRFPRGEVERFLPAKVLEGYDRLCQEESLRRAGLSDLVQCPFCDYAAIVGTDAETDRLFYCQSATCGTISCRLCRKPNHLPASCEEAAKDSVLDARHEVEEAMTEALLRECNGCRAKFFKTEGCNKMQCPRCNQLMCYVCKKTIGGYDHFNQDQPAAPGVAAAPDDAPDGRCPLWDDSERRNAVDVGRAAADAVRRLRDARPDVAEAEIAVAPPVVPEPPPPPPQPMFPPLAMLQPMPGRLPPRPAPPRPLVPPPPDLGLQRAQLEASRGRAAALARRIRAVEALVVAEAERLRAREDASRRARELAFKRDGAGPANAAAARRAEAAAAEVDAGGRHLAQLQRELVEHRRARTRELTNVNTYTEAIRNAEAAHAAMLRALGRN